MEEKDDIPYNYGAKLLEEFRHGSFGSEFQNSCLRGLQILTAEKSRILCSFVVRSTVSDENGNWHTGAIFSAMDILCAVVADTSNGVNNLSVDFNVSYLATVKTEEEVELEAKVLSRKGKLTCVLVEVRRKGSKDVVTFGKQWMSVFSTKSKL